MSYHHVLLALFASVFTWLVTALGAALVFFFKHPNRKFFNAMLGFAAGIMIAASFWSLLSPAVEMAKLNGIPPWIPAISGFLGGGVFIHFIDRLLPLIHKRVDAITTVDRSSSWQRSFLLVFTLTLHKIPEGLAIGTAFGVLSANPDTGILAGAIALTLGIAIQTFPEGAAISIPLRREGFSRLKAFNFGQLSGLIMPVSALLGVYLVTLVSVALPYALSFAAGAMLFVVIRELIPESHNSEDNQYATVGAMLGIAMMLYLDVALG